MTSNRLISSVLMLVAMVLVVTELPRAQSPEPIASHRDDAILTELRSIRQLVERLIVSQQTDTQTRTPNTAKLTNLKAALALGSTDAPLTMVEFVDLQCPFCRQYQAETFALIKEHWIDTGKLRYVVRDFPLEDIHPQAMNAARAARCGADQNKPWDIRERLMRSGQALTKESIIAIAVDIGLDAKAFASCFDSDKYDKQIRGDIAEAQSVGITGTPSFVLGRSTPQGLDGTLIVGAMPYSVFDSTLGASFRAIR